ncbi:MAG: hypothetical protein R2705_25300 [Ilumatobacteraceae bacterium]
MKFAVRRRLARRRLPIAVEQVAAIACHVTQVGNPTGEIGWRTIPADALARMSGPTELFIREPR